MADGSEFTVSTLVTLQPPGSVYVIVGSPLLTPDTIPEAEPTDACSGLLLVQVPPAGVELSVTVELTQTDEDPVIGVGSGFTVKVILLALLHPADVVPVTVYVTVTVGLADVLAQVLQASPVVGDHE